MYCTVLASFLLFTLGVRGGSVEYEVLSTCGEDAVLSCMAEAELGVDYHSVIWYKLNDDPSQQFTGLVMKRLTENSSTLQRYKGFTRDVKLLEDSQDLVLYNVTQQDAGKYLCFLSAPIGHRNQEGTIQLKVFECPRDEENDTLYMALAVTLLIMALLMFYVSYICLRNTLSSHKHKLSKENRLKTTQKLKHVIVSLESNGLVSKVLHQEYV